MRVSSDWHEVTYREEFLCLGLCGPGGDLYEIIPAVAVAAASAVPARPDGRRCTGRAALPASARPSAGRLALGLIVAMVTV